MAAIFICMSRRMCGKLCEFVWQDHCFACSRVCLSVRCTLSIFGWLYWQQTEKSL